MIKAGAEGAARGVLAPVTEAARAMASAVLGDTVDAVDGYLAARVSRQTRRIGGRMGNAYRYASVYFVPLGFAKGWLKGSGGRPAARLFFFFGNYPAGTFRAALPLRERAISENSTPGRTGVPAEEVRTCLAGAFALRAIS